MKSAQVSGRFIDEAGNTLEGTISFLPSKLWIEEGEHTYPTLAYECPLVNGTFQVHLTRTDQDELPWHYTVKCPVGSWTIRVEDDGPLLLKDLLPSRFA